MEKQLFSWQGWDGEPECMTFYKPELKVKIGNFNPGHKFDVANILNKKSGEGVLQLIKYGDEGEYKVFEFKLFYSIGEQILN